MTLRAAYIITVLAVFGLATATLSPSVSAAQTAGLAPRADRVVIEKAAHRMTLFDGDRAIRSYDIALGHGGLARKTRQGDGRTPEGRYQIDSRNPQSHYHLALHISYPEARDVKAAAALGASPGGDIMIHGLPNGLGAIGSLHRSSDWTAGCIAVTDAEIEEIWRSVPDGTPVEIRP